MRAAVLRCPAIISIIYLFAGFLFGCASIAGDDIDSPEEASMNYRRTIEFSGYRWQVKESPFPVGPGPNYFSASSRNVGQDEEGRLILSVTERKDRWFCAEVICERSFGYGTYLFQVSAVPALFDSQLVAGFFIYDTDPAYEHREIDIEFSRWGKEKNPNSQYVIQPAAAAGNMFRFTIPPEMRNSTHCIRWTPDALSFFSYDGHISLGELAHERPFSRWTWEGSQVPPPGNEHVRINCYLYQGKAPHLDSGNSAGTYRKETGIGPLSIRVDGFSFLKITSSSRNVR
jgi:hypothetical protein